MNLDITPDQLEVFKVLKNMRMKDRICWVYLTCFTMITIVLGLTILGVVPAEFSDKLILGAVESLFLGTVYPMTQHFFPAIVKTIRSTRHKKVKQ